jgi:hypothetical protein
MFGTLVAAKRKFLAAYAEEQIRFALAKELLQQQPKTQITQEALIACVEADEAMDRLEAAIRRVEQLQSN